MVNFKLGEEMRKDVMNMSRERDTLYMRLCCSAHHKSFVAQWLERLSGVRKILGSLPVWDSDFLFNPCS